MTDSAFMPILAAMFIGLLIGLWFHDPITFWWFDTFGDYPSWFLVPTPAPC